MADQVITKQELIDAHKDAKTLEEVVNGSETKQVTTRLGENYPSVKKAIKTLFENGGLPATSFATKALMTASVLDDGKYAIVTDDAVNNGLYLKTSGAWAKSGYDPTGQAITHIDNTLDRKMLDVLRPEYTKASKNLLDPSEVIHDCYITTGGAIVYSLGAVTSPKVKVFGESAITISGLKPSSTHRAVCYFDKTGEFVSLVGIAPQLTQITYTNIPANAYYIQFTIRLAADAEPYDPSLLQLESGRVASSYTPFLKGDLKRLLGSDIYQRDDIEDKINNTLNPVFKVGSKNLFDPSEIIMDKTVMTSDGSLGNYTGSASSGRINIEGKSLIISGIKSTTQYKGVCFYDEDGVFIAANNIAPGLTSKSFSPPVGAVFVQFTIKTHDDPSPLDISTLQVEYGNVATDYEPYAKGDLVSLYGVPIGGGSEGSATISKAFGANYLIFGDSITSTSRVTSGLFDETYYMNWPVYAKDILNMGEFRNYAVSGASFKDRSIEPYQFMGLQIETSITNEETPDVIIIACGTNDGNGNIGTYEEAMSKATLDDLDQTIILEAARHAFWTLRLAYPDAVCFFANPLQRMSNTTEQLAPAVNALGVMAKRYGFNLIDQNNCSGIIRELEVYQGEGKYLRDGLHTNNAGMKKQAEFICSQVISRMMY